MRTGWVKPWSPRNFDSSFLSEIDFGGMKLITVAVQTRSCRTHKRHHGIYSMCDGLLTPSSISELKSCSAPHRRGIGCHGGKWFISKEKRFRKTTRPESLLRLTRVMLQKDKLERILDRKWEKISCFQLRNVATALFFFLSCTTSDAWKSSADRTQQPSALIRHFHGKSWRKCINSLKFSTLCSIKIIYYISAGCGMQPRSSERCPSRPCWQRGAPSVAATVGKKLQIRAEMSRCHERSQKRDQGEHADTGILSPWVSLEKFSFIYHFLSGRWSQEGGWLLTVLIWLMRSPPGAFPSVSQSEVMCYLSSLWNRWLNWRCVQITILKMVLVSESIYLRMCGCEIHDFSIFLALQ